MERITSSSKSRLQIILLLMALWDLLGAVIELLGDTFAFEINDIDGVLAARALSGALVIPAILYLYAFRHPLRHRGILWIAVVEQLVAILTAVYHLAADHIELESVIMPLAVAIAFLVLVLLNFPRGAEAEMEPERPLEQG